MSLALLCEACEKKFILRLVGGEMILLRILCMDALYTNFTLALANFAWGSFCLIKRLLKILLQKSLPWCRLPAPGTKDRSEDEEREDAKQRNDGESLYRKELCVIWLNSKTRPAPAGVRGTEICIPGSFLSPEQLAAGQGLDAKTKAVVSKVGWAAFPLPPISPLPPLLSALLFFFPLSSSSSSFCFLLPTV